MWIVSFSKIQIFKLRSYGKTKLLDIVVGLAGAELGHIGGLVLLLVQAGHGGVQGGAGDQVLLPGDLVGGVSLALSTGAEADAGDAVTALDGDAVGGEGPLVDQGTVTQVHSALGPDALLAEQGVVGVHQSLDVGGVLLVDPSGEVGLGLVHLAGPGGTVVHVHGDLHVVAVLLHAGQVPDLLQAGIPGLASGHAAVDGDGAGVSHSAAAGGGVENLAGGAGAAAQETGVLVVLGVVLGVEHLHEALDFLVVGVVVLVEGADVLEDVGHLVDGVVAALGGGAVAGDALPVPNLNQLLKLEI